MYKHTCSICYAARARLYSEELLRQLGVIVTWHISAMLEMIGRVGRNGYGKSPFQWENQLFLWAIFYICWFYERVELLSVTTEYITSLTVDFPEMAMGARETERAKSLRLGQKQSPL